MSFVYPPLPTGVDAIRIVDLEPGGFNDHLAGALRSVAFRDKPKYVALSYTWGSSYPDNADLQVVPSGIGSETIDSGTNRKRKGKGTRTGQHPAAKHPRTESPSSLPASSSSATILLNGQPLRIGHNLCLALRYLRSPTHTIPFWVDAVTINQSDADERNQQVSLMAFVYTRATTVVAWLGTKHYESPQDCFHAMHHDWHTGNTRHLRQRVVEDQRVLSSSFPDDLTLHRIMKSAYWTRLWVVQEMCLPRVLLLAYSAQIWEFDEFRRHQLSAKLPRREFKAAIRLLETRDKRHTDTMKFENLIEIFSDSHCSEIRDKIYGLVGCANDVRPFAGRDDRAEALKAHIDRLTSGVKSLSSPARSGGAIKVDYSRPFYDIWVDVVGFAYFQGREFDQDTADLSSSYMNTSGLPDQVPQERRMSIVRTAGMVQGILDQRVAAEALAYEHSLGEQEHACILAQGYVAGKIVHIGPDYTSLVGSSSASQDWSTSWIDHFHDVGHLETIRISNELYMAEILDYDDSYVSDICTINNPHVTAWRQKEDRPNATNPDDEHTNTFRNILGSEGNCSGPPHICVTSECTMGLVPPNALVGDVIIRFHKCNAAMVMRPVKGHSQDGFFVLIGRADVPGLLHLYRDQQGSTAGPRLTKKASAIRKQRSAEVYVELNLRTLQKITANIITFNK